MATDITLRSTKGSALTHDEMDTNLTNLQTTADDALAATDTLTSDKAEAAALGVANTDQNMGSFTGSTISDNVSAKAGMQALETAVETKANATAVGVTASAANMGTYTGSTIPDNETAKQNLQSLETAVETKANASALGVTSSAADMGTFTGSTIPDSQTAKQALQALETAVEARVARATTRAAMDDFITTAFKSVYLEESGREGTFVWSSANNSTNVTNDPQQGIFVPPSSDTTGASGAWVRKFAGFAYIAEWFGATGDGTTNDATAINNAMATVNYLLGGDILFGAKTYKTTAVLDLKYPRVRLVGVGNNTFHDAGTETARTIFKTDFAGTGLKIRTPYAAEQGIAVGNTYKYTGAGCVGITFDGNGTATKAIEIDSVSLIDIDVYATGYVGTTVYEVKCGVTNTDLGEACDVQHSRMIFRARQIDTAGQKASDILTLTGSSNANVSVNRGPLHGISVICQHWDGDALRVISADNNDIMVFATRPGGSGNTVYGHGPTASNPVGCEGNNFVYLNGAGAVYAEGTDTGGVTGPVINRIEHLDTGNGTPVPTQGTGSLWRYENNDNVVAGFAFNKLAISDSPSAAKTQRAAMATETLRLHNTSSDHASITDDSGNEWSVRINAANGNLDIIRVSGTGLINLGDNVRIFNTISVGAADSGGAGYSVLRVPN